jgi:hypothetical protein
MKEFEDYLVPHKQLYDEGRQLFLSGKLDDALERFKRIYELDSGFRDVAKIVEDAFSLPGDEWRGKYQMRFESSRHTI